MEYEAVAWPLEACCPFCCVPPWVSDHPVTTYTMSLITFLENSHCPSSESPPCNVDVGTISDGCTTTSEPIPLRYPQTIGTMVTLLLLSPFTGDTGCKSHLHPHFPTSGKASLKIWQRRQSKASWMESEKPRT